MKVLYFAQAAEAAGCREERWECSRPLAVEDFWVEAIRRHPQLAVLRPRCRLASGGRYLEDGDCINLDQETAIIPPVSGG